MRNKSGLNERLHFLSLKSAFISQVVRSCIFLIVAALEQNAETRSQYELSLELSCFHGIIKMTYTE